MPSLTILDLVLAAIMLISGFLAMLRGLTRELLSIAAWVAAAGAAGITYFFYQDEIKQLVPIQPEIAAVGGVAALVFLIVLVVVSLLTIKVGDWVLDSSIGALDRTLGLLFGLARGIILVGIIFWFFIKFTDDKSRPDFIEDAYSRDAIMWTSNKLEQVGQKFALKIMGILGKGEPEDPDQQ
jgi:membrane protein required for colicin V production